MSITERNDQDMARGLYRKFDVRRVDADAQARHGDCDYFVLDIDHDPLALVALTAYADAARAAGYVTLSDDLLAKIAAVENMSEDDDPTVTPLCTMCGRPGCEGACPPAFG